MGAGPPFVDPVPLRYSRRVSAPTDPVPLVRSAPAPAETLADHGAAALPVHVALLTVALLFGGNYVVAKFAFREVSPLTLVVLRSWGAAAILFAASAVHHRTANRPPLSRSDLGELFLYGFLGSTVNQICFLEGLSRSTATNASVMLVTIPVLTLTFAVLLGRERATAAGVAGIALGLSGALLLIVPRGDVDLSASATVGNILLLVGGSSFALYLVLTRPILARHDPLRVMSWIFLFSGLTVLPLGITGVGAIATHGLSTGGWASVAYVVIGSTAIPYLLNSWALVRVKSSLVAVYILVQPVVAGTLGWMFLDERVGANTAVAAALVVAGVVLSARRPRRPADPPSVWPTLGRPRR
jgi:drug/metabolite transporter (DMT)-like permease